MQITLSSEAEMIAFGVECARCIGAGEVVFLDGDLGAGKTTLAKGLLKGWGYQGAVTSPTFTLLESYQLAVADVHHFDLYRMESAQELEMIGARELFNPQSICLLEWPQRAAGYLPAADVTITIRHSPRGRHLKVDAKDLSRLKNCLNL